MSKHNVFQKQEIMNSRERVITALQHKKPDRVPLMELWIDAKVVQALLPGGTWNDLIEQLGMDVVTVPTMVYGPDEIEWLDKSKGLFRDKWGALQQLTEEAVPVPAQPARIETEDDLANYRPPDPAKSPVLAKIAAFKKKYPNGEKAIAVIGESGWAPGVFLRGGLENILMDLGLRPEFIAKLMDVGANYYSELYRLAIAAGADIILLGDDYAGKIGPIMSPAQFAEVVLPADRKVVQAVKNAGGYCIKHTDGDIRKIMDGLVSTGLDCLGPIEPLPGMELEGILNRYPGKISVMGSVDVDLLSRGTEEEVVKETKRYLRTVSPGGAHIFSSGNSITSSVKPANFLAMIETVKTFGKYPIDPVM
jgi:uroporphyrinogen decarboxylase